MNIQAVLREPPFHVFKGHGANHCWIWPKALSTDGYGLLKIGGRSGKMQRAHRYAFTLAKRKPKGVVTHTCHNRACCNPRHLKDTSWRSIHARMMREGRHRSMAGIVLKGEKHPLSVLSDKEREYLRRLWKRGWSARALGWKFGVSSTTAYRIAKTNRS